jgi:hypothetical protein
VGGGPVGQQMLFWRESRETPAIQFGIIIAQVETAFSPLFPARRRKFLIYFILTQIIEYQHERNFT